MKRWAQWLLAGVRIILESIGNALLWLSWFGLAALLAVQIYVANRHELALPEFALRRIEAKLAEAGLRAAFSRTLFDPTGRLLVENILISAPAFTEPILAARSVYVRFSPWLLFMGRLEPREIRVTGATVTIPTLLSPNGKPEEIIQSLEATLEPDNKLLVIRQLSAVVAGVVLSARGTIPLPRAAPARPLTETLEEFFAKQFPTLSRQALTWRDWIAGAAENPVLELGFAPSESGATAIRVVALTTRLKLATPVAFEADGVRATTRILWVGQTPPSHVELQAREVRLPAGVTVNGLDALVYGRIRPADTGFDLREVAVTVNAVAGAGFGLTAVSGRVFPRPFPRLKASIVANAYGAPLGLEGDVDLQERTALVKFAGPISPRVLDPLSAKLGVNVRRYYDFDALTAERAEARFGPGWKFEKLSARVRIPRMNSYGVIMEDGRATVELEPGRFYSPDAFARIGENYARGTYEHNLETHQYRFLLEGRLQPMAISHWFRDWWSSFFRQLEFPGKPPEASVDVAGFWRASRQSNVFVFADAAAATIRGVNFDRVRTRMFIRPGFFDGLELLATHGKGAVQGRFTFVTDAATGGWRTLELGLDSTLDLKVAAQLLPPKAAAAMEPFKLAAPPTLKVRGSFAGPEATKKTPDRLRIEARTEGEFRYHGFPLHDLSFIATLEDDALELDDVEATFAGGVTGGKARVWGTGDQRKLGFDFALKDATLGQVAGTLQHFLAERKGEPTPAPGKFLLEKANIRLNVAASAEGRFNDLASFRGDGNASLSGGEIGEVPLLGQLSELLKFTALRFTEARANFKIDGPKLVFPQLELRGSNAAIDAHGEYNVVSKTLDFNAKIFPFQESGNLIKTVVGAVLTPLSNAFEVKLKGSLTQPEWAFVMGPTSFLRSLNSTGGPHDADAKTPPPPASSNSPPEASPRNR